MKDGILNINKPAGMTSHDVVRDLRRLFGIKKIGHTGTLDPMATGVLPICIGKATRITEYTDLDFKKYRCTLRLGLVTDTQDIWGTVLEENATDGINPSDVEKAFSGFCGYIEQFPPMYSAVRVDGRRLYEYARAGESVDVKSRRVYIKSLEIEAMDFAYDSDIKKVTFTVECSKGTYIRTICEDVGKILGCGAAMESLCRIASGAFEIENAIDLNELIDKYGGRRYEGEKYFVEAAGETALADIEKLVLPTDYPLTHFGTALLDAEYSRRFIDGWHIAMHECEITARPEFESREPEIEIRDEYRRAYKIYGRLLPKNSFAKTDGNGQAADEDAKSESAESGRKDGSCIEPVFLGIAFYDKKYKKLVADKVFCRNDEL